MIWELDMDITRIFLFPLNLWCLHYKIGFSATHNHSILFYFSEQNCIKQKIASVNYFSLQEDPLIIQILSPPWRSWIVYLFRWKNIHIFRTSHYDAVFPNDTFYMKPVNNSWEWLFFFFFFHVLNWRHIQQSISILQLMKQHTFKLHLHENFLKISHLSLHYHLW